MNAPAVRAAIDQLEQRALASGRMYEPITVDVNKDATVANITVPIDGKGTDARLERRPRPPARRDRARRRSAQLPNAEAGVTGLTAQWKDGTDEIEVEAAARVRLRARCSRSG